MRVPIRKYHSLGNDFIVVDAADLGVPHGQSVDRSLIRRWCQRSFGLGADGVLVLFEAIPEHPHRVDIYNQDGSDGGFSGNGVRIALWHLMQRHQTRTCTVLMGPNQVHGYLDESGAVVTQMELVTQPQPMALVLDSTEWSLFHVDVGNPHLILLDCDHDARWLEAHADLMVLQLGLMQGANVHLVKASGGHHYEMLIHERGVGLTHACSSGAMALMALLWDQQSYLKDELVMIRMPGGVLCAQYDGCRVQLRAPVVSVLEGQLLHMDE